MEWYQAVLVMGVAFGVAYAMVPVSKRIAVRIGAIDYPGNRRVNSDPIPRCGGIALYAGLVAAFATIAIGVLWFGWQFPGTFFESKVNPIGLFLGITVIFVVGLIDDVTQLSPAVKFAGQVAAAVIVVFSGVTIGQVHLGDSEGFTALGWIDAPLTVIYLVVFANITNLIDGLDGLAAGTVAIVTAALMYVVFTRGNIGFMLVCLAVIAVCLAFLRYNFYPASVFMGDSGSLLLGLAVGIVAVAGVARVHSLVAMLVPLVMAGVPAIDTVFAVLRRLRNHQPIDQADMGHIHHRLLRMGLSQRNAVFVLWGCSAALSVMGCLFYRLSWPLRWVVLAGLVAIVVLIIYKLGLFESVLRHHYDNKGKRGPRVPPQG